MKILRGKKIADDILWEAREEIKQNKLRPVLAVILVGEDEASKIYVALKEKAANQIELDFRRIDLQKDVAESELRAEIDRLNRDSEVNGIIVQLPLPEHLDKNRIIQSIAPQKDVDGFHWQKTFTPVFPSAIRELLLASGESLENKKAMIICNSSEFGEAMRQILEQDKARPQYIFRSQIQEKIEEIKRADILITACGQPNLVNAKLVKVGAVVIDGGIVRMESGKVCGDVDVESLRNVVGFLSPVPGGVGPVTIACLLRNVVLAARKRTSEKGN